MGSAGHRAVAREAVAKSQVLPRNEGAVLPLEPGRKVYVAGPGADDLGRRADGWTIGWQGSSGRATTGTTILEGMRRAAPGAVLTWSEDASAPTAGHDVGVVVGETPYAEGAGDVGNGLGLAGTARLIVQERIGRLVTEKAARPFAEADHLLLAGDLVGAVDGLTEAYRAAG